MDTSYQFDLDGSLDFFADRLKVALREKGVRHDLIDAVFSLGGEDDLVRLLARVEALGEFLKTDDGANLLVAYRRASNIVAIEEKKDKKTYDGAVNQEELTQPEEVTLAKALGETHDGVQMLLKREEFRGCHEGDGPPSEAGRCLFRQGDRERAGG